jgi:hypothetical protein
MPLDDPKLPLHLLLFALQSGITTLTCISDFLNWEPFTTAQKANLGQLYVPYLVLAIFMGVDMFWRLDRILGAGPTVTITGKNK